MTMVARSRRFLVGSACLALAAAGCGKDPFAPPARIKTGPTVFGAEGSKPSFLIFVAPSAPQGDVDVWAARAQHEANSKRAVFRIMAPGVGEGAEGQAAVVRKALSEGASALVVVPGDSPELPRALAEAEAKGVPIVLIDREIPAPDGAKPFTVVEHGPFDESARKIVETTVGDLIRAGKPSDGSALVMVDKVVDRTSAARVAALEAAAKGAKFRQVVRVPFDSTAEASARLAVLEAVKANPDTSVVLADDAESLLGAGLARAELAGKPVIFVGGYTDYRTSSIVAPPVRESCSVEGRYSELGGLAVVTAFDRIGGEPAGRHHALTSRFVKGEGAVSYAGDVKSPLPGPKSAESLSQIIKDIAPPEETPKAPPTQKPAPKP